MREECLHGPPPKGKTTVYFKAQNLKPISAENETRALKRLRVLCRDALLDFSTTQEQDLELLARGGPISFNERNCIVYRAGEKTVVAILG